jgi:asparagine synthase (glutamine-hydrolysing)
MCGICGVVYFDDRPVDRDLIVRMSDAQSHRGPDESGVKVSGRAGLGHRRLSIIDLSTGQQPLSNEDGSVWIVFNGEIYNYGELHERLKGSHAFRTRSDTETIVHLYESCPNGFVKELRGMFSFALWDEPRRTLILARDRVGKKPLYYYADKDKLVFGSEIKSILQHPDLRLDVDEQAVSDYVSLGYVPAPKSIYQAIRKVRPGHYLKVIDRRIEEIKYWDLSFQQAPEASEQQWQERILDALTEAVDIRLMSEVPLGAFLSGGVDSSAVVATMSRILARPVKTATIGFEEDAFDESGFAREVARYLGTDHHERRVTADTIATIEKLVWHYDEPFADSSALPTYFVSQAARDVVTVALSGDGGDENFAGYRRYRFDVQENRVRDVFPGAVRARVFGPLGRAYPKMDWAPRVLRAKSTLQSLAEDSITGYFQTMSTFRRHEKTAILSGDVRAALKGYDTAELFREYAAASDATDALSRIQYLDIKTYLTDDILTKVDRASMANSLEVRCPLLDHKFMELVASMPAGLKLKGMTGKYIFKQALRPSLPPSVFNRPKMGFAIPLASWFRNGIRQYAETYLLETTDPFLSPDFVGSLWRQHQSGRRDRSTELWNVLMFRLWYAKIRPR